jgi:Arc/MetJ-type ribon-helix-helix transcriptional regulator
MPTPEDKVKINARVPKNLYDWIGDVYGNVSQAVNEGLELLRETQSVNCDTIAHNSPQSSPQSSPQEPTSQNDELSKELKETLEALRNADKNNGHQQARIDDLKSQVQVLYEQLHTKDEQIEKLNENMHKQAVHTQSLIQEISRLNIKSLPEAPTEKEIKKPWYKFW